MTKIPNGEVPGSFRDPSGSLFYQEGILYRRVNECYREDYNHLMTSGLYDSLVEKNLIVQHEETILSEKCNSFKILRPIPLDFISYPYEWCFSQLKDAALTTLKIQDLAFEFGMTLKDASAYNIQFHAGKPVHIDTLSFKRYAEGETWPAYRQFCQHFLAPLALMSCKDVRLNQLFRIHIDGIPLDLASRLLGHRTWLRFPLLTHIHLHSISQKFFSGRGEVAKGKGMGRNSFLGLIDSLRSAVLGLKWVPENSEWSGYYEENSYSLKAADHKKQVVNNFLSRLDGKMALDIGANTGVYSRISAEKGVLTLSVDADHAAVEENYLKCVEKNESNLLPLVCDICNPSPGIGWNNEERESLICRFPKETVLALALIHHLAISNNLPLEKAAAFFGGLCRWLIIEFVPKSDPQVQRLLATREDIFPDYTIEGFEAAFGRYFDICASEKVSETERTVYLMRRNDA